MIVNFRATKWVLFRLAFGISIILNIYAITAFNAVDRCDTTKVEQELAIKAEQLKDL
jgi:hypothetical protein